MRARPTDRVTERPTLPVVEGKTSRVTVLLTPQLSQRLKLFALFHDVDLGDVVTAAVTPLLSGFVVSQRSSPAVTSAGDATDRASGVPDGTDRSPGLRVSA